MLLSITLENYRSFWEKTTLSLVPTAQAGDRLDAYRFYRAVRANLRVPKCCFIYGPNASGKTNFMRALETMQLFLAYSTQLGHLGELERNTRDCYHISRRTAHGTPSTVSVKIVLPERVFTYTLSFVGTCIHGESLVSTHPLTGKGLVVYQCQKQGAQTEMSTDLVIPESIRGNIMSLLADKPESQTALQCLTQQWLLKSSHPTWHEALHRVYGYLLCKISYVSAARGDTPSRTVNFFEKYPQRAVALTGRLLRGCDAGANIPVAGPQASGDYALPVYNDAHELVGHQPIEWGTLSNGTQRLLNLMSLLAEPLSEGGVLLWDEVEQSLHPVLVQQLLHAIASCSFKVPVQIICTSHSPCFLSMTHPEGEGKWLTEEQVFFMMKDYYGGSRMRNFGDIRRERAEDPSIQSESWAMDYLNGLYGAYPQVDLDSFVRFAAGANLHKEG